jgi:O-antigen ligase
VALAACALIVIIVPGPWAGLTRAARWSITGMAGLAAWTLASAVWSPTVDRAAADGSRLLLYAAGTFYAAAVATTPARLQLMLRWAGAALVLTCAVALITRLAPDVWAPRVVGDPERLAYPIGYWNGLALLAALACLSCVHFALQEESGAWRWLAAASLPVCAVTLYFTFSRAGIAALAVGGVVYLASVRSTRAFVALAGLLPTTCTALLVAVTMRSLATPETRSPAALHSGHWLAVVMLIAVAVSPALLSHTLKRELWLVATVRAAVAQRRRAALVLGAVLVLSVAVFVAAGLPAKATRAVGQFRSDDSQAFPDTRDRLTFGGGGGRTDLWRVALTDFQRHPVIGAGSGAFAVSWAERRRRITDTEEPHSVYLEMLGELGLVGGVLLAVVLAAAARGLIRRLDGADRPLVSLACGGGAAWAIAAAVDWQWEIPCNTLWALVAVTGALSAYGPRRAAPRTDRRARIAAAGVLVALAAWCVTIASAQHDVDRAKRALASGDLTSALGAADRAKTAAPYRADPYQLATFALIRQRRWTEAQRELVKARSRAHRSWKLSLLDGVLRASRGEDPGPALERTRRLNPLTSILENSWALRTPDLEARRRAAVSAATLLASSP